MTDFEIQQAMDRQIAANAVGKLRGRVTRVLTHEIGEIRIYLERPAAAITEDTVLAILDRVKHLEQLVAEVETWEAR